MSENYIHGFSRNEQARLITQARTLASNLFAGLDLSSFSDALELGCGVGAELKIMTERWPRLNLTGLDKSESHLLLAKQYLDAEIQDHRVRLVSGDAFQLPFPKACFDVVITIWLLEHISEPKQVISEALRVLKPDGYLICTEVDNATFGFEPESKVISEWWKRFNAYQQIAGGDPFIGARLGEIADALECKNVQTVILPIISSRQEPNRRQVLLDYLRDLLLSGLDNMRTSGLVDEPFKQSLINEFANLKVDDSVDFQYFATRLMCQSPIKVPPSLGMCMK